MIWAVLAALGLTFILKQGRILNEVRSFLINIHPLINDLFSCAQCLGFWSGIIIAILLNYNIVNILLLGLITSFIGLLTQTLICFIETIYIKNTNKE